MLAVRSVQACLCLSSVVTDGAFPVLSLVSTVANCLIKCSLSMWGHRLFLSNLASNMGYSVRCDTVKNSNCSFVKYTTFCFVAYLLRWMVRQLLTGFPSRNQFYVFKFMFCVNSLALHEGWRFISPSFSSFSSCCRILLSQTGFDFASFCSVP